jgi:hypothetical protein
MGVLFYFLWFFSVAWPVDAALQVGARRTAVVAGLVMALLPVVTWWALLDALMLMTLIVIPILQIVTAFAIVRYVRRRAPSPPERGERAG